MKITKSMTRKETLKILRIKNNLTQKDVAEALGISVAAYSLIENGKRKGSIENWSKLQKVFNLKGDETWELLNKDR